ncbi:hypothetical protein [Flavobacterium reichenbachii]|uniref:HMA domain-containing protein n=1 Tax=Flavobacterium reichenbachii TaxID=362418 RepID=A0A085ZF18_9FLAO|nr:hypothetical protein [Flavobacterium reichenbachii]KFF03032.1 hypothetical protein IW19_23150 [Flavobacterium reichenbachii]OXB17179.1 hypothetical protein B0A68_05120 [Flavobacterium reichenbachii]
MKTNLNTIHIFKTNILQVDPACPLREALNNHEDIKQWSIDCEDIDCVLRVVSETMKPNEIIALINQFGYECQELL